MSGQGIKLDADSQNRILIVEDNVLGTIVSQFRKPFYAESGSQAIEFLKNETFDLVLTDFEMDNGNGLDLLQHMTTTGSKVPTVMVTAFGNKDLILQTLKHHVFGFIEKPFKKSAIETLVLDALCLKQKEDRLQRFLQLGTSTAEIMHELASPLTLLEAHIDRLKTMHPDVNAQIFSKETAKIRKIIQNARNQLLHEKSELVPFNLQGSVDDASEEFHIRAKTKGVSVQVKGSFNCMVHGSKEQLRQVIVNLMNNAVDAAADTPEKWAELVGDIGHENLGIRVRDSGAGIPIEYQERIFQPLFSTKGKAGTGLGLTIIQKIIREHKGELILNKESPNTEFMVRIPLYKH
jgi:signal transduction histidine kinase